MISFMHGGARTFGATELLFPDFAISWAGPGPSPDQFCLGSDDGRLLIAATSGALLKPPFAAVDSGEAINGVAFADGAVAVSTRNEVAVLQEAPTSNGQGTRSVFHVGAHGVMSTSGGLFIAPAGRSGLIVVRPERGEIQHVGVVQPPDMDLYFYRVVPVKTADGKEILACAARGAGIAAMQVPAPTVKSDLSWFALEGLDIVDVCALGCAVSTPAVCALERNGGLAFFRNVLQDTQPVAVKFEEIQGTAYRLLSAKGHLFLLTSRGVYILTELSKGFLEGKDVQRQPTLVRQLSRNDIVDANLAQDQWLLLVLTDKVAAFGLDEITEPAGPGAAQPGDREVLPTAMEQTWQSGGREATLAALAQ